jgi:tRNA wybutosine-synthesizing protein 3
MGDLEKTRFDMIKKHHTNTLKKAIKEGKADQRIIPFLLEITKIKDIFTSSSCCGRILLLSSNKNENKKYSSFHKRFHRLVEWDEFIEAINNSNKNYLWLKVEPFIFHIGCSNYKKAEEILQFCRDFGLKKAGIISAKKGKFIIEITNTIFMSTLIKKDKDLLVSNTYLKEVLELANNKLDQNYKKLNKFEKAFLDRFLVNN